MARIIDGKAIAAGIQQQTANQVRSLKSKHNLTPGLAVVLIGENPASQVYVRNKVIQTTSAGMKSFHHQKEKTISEADTLDLINQLNMDSQVNGILVQLPLPDHINADKVINAIDPDKDVDGFHVVNTGRLTIGLQGMAPCTPLGCVELMKSVKPDLTGSNAVIVGRSNIVGKPLASLLLREHCTVTIAHSRTRKLNEVCKRADILVAAVGRPKLVKGSWVKSGAIVIDVGINRIETESGKMKLVGDVDFAEARKVAGAITPVPGGVGPMTIALLLQNTVRAACIQHGIPLPD